MFKKVLIANRGEIACRIIRTARRLGMATVAVYSDADRHALHVREADEAFHLGPSQPSASYLNIDRLIAACRATGADCVHPGYGFLSERAEFAQLLAAEGIAFIGPNAAAIDAMGDKIRSKRIAAAAGVSVLPGSLDPVTGEAEAMARAEAIGYPVILKASAGGGGKGMRIARNPDELREGFALARSEAGSAFGDDTVFLEVFVENSRHIEVQVLGDRHGNVLHLGERECSIQRRNQKVVEETPSPLLDAAARAEMTGQSVALARAAGYDSAGTVEFVVGQDQKFFFLEMNTRLQVEHPVTEMVTGMDIVEWMFRVAAGEALPYTQDDIGFTGSAVETRIYAEDPAHGFVPSPGRLVRFRPPAPADGLRVDSGVVEGSTIPVEYDPMIAKLVTHAATRDEAIDAHLAALDGFAVDGLAHNVPFLAALLRLKRFRDGALSTALIAEEFPGGFSAPPPVGEDRRIAARIAASIDAADSELWLNPGSGARSLVLDGEVLDCPAGAESGWHSGDPVWIGTVDGAPVAATLRFADGAVHIDRAGTSALARCMSPAQAAVAYVRRKQDGSAAGGLVSPLAGRVAAVLVREGDAVAEGDPVLRLEAMKMEILVRSDRAGQVARLLVAPGALVATGDRLAEFEPA